MASHKWGCGSNIRRVGQPVVMRRDLALWTGSEVARCRYRASGCLSFMVIMIALPSSSVGPDKPPEVAADLARWIKRAAPMASTHARLQRRRRRAREGSRRQQDDWKEIASVIRREGTGLSGILNDTTRESTTRLNPRKAEANIDLDAAKADPTPDNVVSIDTARNGDGEDGAESAAEATEAAGEGSTEEKPWYVPERTTSRRRSID